MASERAPFMLTEAEYSYLLTAVCDLQIRLLDARRFDACRILTCAFGKVENELVAADVKNKGEVTIVQKPGGQLRVQWPDGTY